MRLCELPHSGGEQTRVDSFEEGKKKTLKNAVPTVLSSRPDRPHRTHQLHLLESVWTLCLIHFCGVFLVRCESDCVYLSIRLCMMRCLDVCGLLRENVN